jgi:hypothetical protein
VHVRVRDQQSGVAEDAKAMADGNKSLIRGLDECLDEGCAGGGGSSAAIAELVGNVECAEISAEGRFALVSLASMSDLKSSLMISLEDRLRRHLRKLELVCQALMIHRKSSLVLVK